MYDKKESQASTLKKQTKLLSFQFSESKHEIRNLLIDNKPWFVAKDICDVLEIQNSRQAVKDLDDDEKLMYKLYTSGQNRKTWLISESGLYALILRSNKPQAKAFRKWITSEVIPTLLKKGYYAMNRKKSNDFVDARDVPFYHTLINECKVRCIQLENTVWISVNDTNRAIHSSTCANQISKKLNVKQPLAQKIWLFGNTHPAWFTNELGLRLLLAGSRKFSNQLNLAL